MQVEKCLLNAALDAAEEIIADIKGVLEEGLAHCHKCRNGNLKSLLKKEGSKFEDLQRDLHRLAKLRSPHMLRT